VVRDPTRRLRDAASAWHALLPELEAMPLSVGSGPLVAIGTTAPVGDSSLRVEASSLHPRTPATRLYNVPLPSASFVGRDAELRELRAALLRDQPRIAVSVEGLPGIGKTELLLRLAHDLAHDGRFPGGIFWLPAESADLSAAWASDAIAGALGIAGARSKNARVASSTR
jgi:hypothetical protein